MDAALPVPPTCPGRTHGKVLGKIVTALSKLEASGNQNHKSTTQSLCPHGSRGVSSTLGKQSKVVTHVKTLCGNAKTGRMTNEQPNHREQQTCTDIRMS
jgi:hypothetical protein